MKYVDLAVFALCIFIPPAADASTENPWESCPLCPDSGPAEPGITHPVGIPVGTILSSLPASDITGPVGGTIPDITSPVGIPVPLVTDPVGIPIPEIVSPVGIPASDITSPVGMPIPVVTSPIVIPVPMVALEQEPAIPGS